MSGQPGTFDRELSMWREGQKVVRLNHALFMRWLADRNLLEHETAGPPSGPLTDDDDAPGGDLWPWSAFADREPA